MGPNAGNGVVGMEMGATMQSNGSNQPQATEYTLQGVMRFLQTEWHRHERDRNAWEIEKQEMKGRIANLEGQARRADATQKALKKYVAILERKVKEQSAQLNGAAATEAAETGKKDRAAKIQEKLRCELDSAICLSQLTHTSSITGETNYTWCRWNRSREIRRRGATTRFEGLLGSVPGRVHVPHDNTGKPTASARLSPTADDRRLARA